MKSLNDNNTVRVLLTVVICVGILYLWQRFLVPHPTPSQLAQQGRQAEPRQAAKDTEGGRKEGEGEKSESRPVSQGGAAAPQGIEAPRGQGPTSLTREGEKLTLPWAAGGARISFTDHGASLRHLELTDPRFQERHLGNLRAIDLVQTLEGKGPWPLLTAFPRSDFVLPENARFRVVARTSHSVRYLWESEQVRIVKDYVLDAKRPVLWLTTTLRNLGHAKQKHRLRISLFSHEGGGGAKAGSMTDPYPRIATGLCYANGELFRRTGRAIRGEDSGGCTEAPGCGMGTGPVTQVGEIAWIGSDDRYFLSALVPVGDAHGQRRCEVVAREGDDAVVEAAMLFPEQELGADEVTRYRFAVYLGPKDLGMLDTVTGPAGEDAHLGESIEFGWLSILARPMLLLMQLFHRLFGNWGLAIILLTVIVKLATLYWTHKSMLSMKAMQQLKPKMDELRDRYGQDKQRLNQEIMNLYRANKVNPLGGCLPMLIQMPVWFALYRTLGNAQELYRSGFVGWITDLTAPDPYYILPIAMGISMFGQQLITPQPMEGPQAKMMKYVMPPMFTFFMLWLPAGLTLYIFVNTLLSIGHQWYMNRQMAPVVKSPAAAGAKPTDRSLPAHESGATPRRRAQQTGEVARVRDDASAATRTRKGKKK